MSKAEVLKIHDFAGAVDVGVGAKVDIGIHYNDARHGAHSRSSHQMVDSVIDEVFAREGIPRDRNLEELCALVARIAVGRLATSQGFTVRYGEIDDPREVVRVELRSTEPIVRDAIVSHELTEE